MASIGRTAAWRRRGVWGSVRSLLRYSTTTRSRLQRRDIGDPPPAFVEPVEVIDQRHRLALQDLVDDQIDDGLGHLDVAHFRPIRERPAIVVAHEQALSYQAPEGILSIFLVLGHLVTAAGEHRRACEHRNAQPVDRGVPVRCSSSRTCTIPAIRPAAARSGTTG
jgi:hypothetical protein